MFKIPVDELTKIKLIWLTRCTWQQADCDENMRRAMSQVGILTGIALEVMRLSSGKR